MLSMVVGEEVNLMHELNLFTLSMTLHPHPSYLSHSILFSFGIFQHFHLRSFCPCEHNTISISFEATNTADASSRTLDRLDPSLIYTQIILEIRLTIKFQEKHIQKFIDYCREQSANSDQQLKSIKRLETKYLKSGVWMGHSFSSHPQPTFIW
jgi:hypothetical protein